MSVRFFVAVLLSVMLPMATFAAEPGPAATTAASTARILGTALRSTDLDRSTKFYTTGLGMVVATTLKVGSITEVIFSFSSDRTQPVILLYKDTSPDKSPPLEHGNAYGRIVCVFLMSLRYLHA